MWLICVILLAAAIAKPDSGIINLAALAVWIGILIGFGVSILIFSVSHAAERGRLNEQEKSLASLRTIVNETARAGKLKRIWGWFKNITLLSLIAYTGMVVSAIAYTLVTALMMIAVGSARTTLKLIGELRGRS